jgi:membrane-bound serine protease (ClpP class)
MMVGLAILFAALIEAQDGAGIFRLKLDDQITPASAEVILSAIDRAERAGAAALIIELNTPGGLETSMREIVSRLIASRVPVVVYVAPSGSRAASAGFIIMLAADVAAMAPGTNAGAARPILASGRDMSKGLEEKVLNDAAAYVRSLAEKRGRDPRSAESAVRESTSFTEREALQKGLIEVVARDESDLLAQLDGRSIKRFDGSQITLRTSGKNVFQIKPTLRQRLLMWLVDPRIAFILFAIGALCIYFEFQHPGAVVPGVVGALSVVLALYGFHFLPINLTGVLLIALAIVLLILEVKVQGFGILGIGGIVAAVIGSLILIDAPDPEMRLPLGLVLGVVIPIALALIFMLRLALRARHEKVTTGASGMIGLRGRAETAIAPEGIVFVRGELWKARSHMKIAPGETVRVIGVEGLTLRVEAYKNEALEPRKASAIEGN